MNIEGMMLWISLGLAGCAGKAMRPAAAPAAGHAPAEVGGDAVSNQQATDLDAAVAAIIARCDAVQLARSIPVACQVDVVGDIARMQLTMANQAAARRYLATVFSELARPFCDLANREVARAGIVVSLYEERMMQVLDCLNGRPSDWVPVADEAP